MIIRPDDGSLVGPDTDVAGSVGGDREANEGKTVWVLIKPDGDYFWVQRPARVSRNRWRAETRFGDPYTEDGHYFGVCAVIDAETPLTVNQKLRVIPDARMTSNLVGVTFKRTQA